MRMGNMKKYFVGIAAIVAAVCMGSARSAFAVTNLLTNGNFASTTAQTPYFR